MQVETDAEVLRLRGVLRDLVALSAIPAAWIGSEPHAVASGLADALVGLLQLDFAFVRLSDPGGAGAVEVTRGSAWTGFPEWLEAHLATSAPFPRKEIVPDAGDGLAPRRGFAVPVGVSGEGGVVAAASERSDFPTPIEQLLLSLAANHAAAAFQGARLIQERKRAEDALRKARDELEEKVVQRTAELRVANDELSALRHVATLVAEGAQSQELFAVVAEEVARVIDVPLVSIARYEPDGTATACASFSRDGPFLPEGKRWSLEGTNVLRLVRETSKPARVGGSSTVEGQTADVPRRRIRSAVGVPIVAAGRVWGAMIVSTAEPEPLAEGTEVRLADFTELLATAIENAESHEALERVGQEQAALRRMATLVARGVRPVEIFSAASDEVGRLFDSEQAVVGRFEPDGSAVVVVGVSAGIRGVSIGTRWPLEDFLASTVVYRTGRAARSERGGWENASGPVADSLREMGFVSTVAAPIVVEGKLWGVMTVSDAREPLPPDAEERVGNFTELVATAISNAEGKAELAASRRRIVAASDEARRRIERDLHDGTQQRLVSLGFAARAAEASVPPDRDDLRTELSGLARDLASAIEELQELSRGIHPAILSEGGLGPALSTLAGRSTIPVELDVVTDMRLPEPIEVAVYYVASEALANVAKHAQASRVEVSLALRDGSLLLTIRDDGIGGADRLRGSGLIGLTDRVEALGGSIRVESRPGEGTHITAELPLEPEVVEES